MKNSGSRAFPGTGNCMWKALRQNCTCHVLRSTRRLVWLELNECGRVEVDDERG